MSERDGSIKLTRQVEFCLPSVPNYIIHKVSPGRRQDGFREADKTDIADLHTAELQAIGRAWTAALIQRASARDEARKATR